MSRILALAGAVFALLACSGGGGDNIVNPPPPPPPPPPPAAPTISVSPNNPTKWVLNGVDTLRYTVSPNTSSCSAATDDTGASVYKTQVRTSITSVTSSQVILVVTNTIEEGKGGMSVTLSCVNGSSGTTAQTFQLNKVSPHFSFDSLRVTTKTYSTGDKEYDVHLYGPGMVAYNGDPKLSYSGTVCGMDGPAVNGTDWISRSEAVLPIGIGAGGDLKGPHKINCANPDPEGSQATIQVVFP